MVALAYRRVYFFDFKVMENTQAAKGEALQQVKAVGYAEK